MPDLPARPSLEHLRKQAKSRRRRSGLHLSRAQYELAREYGFASWPALVRHVHVVTLTGLERALMLAEAASLAAHLRAAPSAAVAEIGGLSPLLLLLRRSIGPRHRAPHMTAAGSRPPLQRDSPPKDRRTRSSSPPTAH